MLEGMNLKVLKRKQSVQTRKAILNIQVLTGFRIDRPQVLVKM